MSLQHVLFWMTFTLYWCGLFSHLPDMLPLWVDTVHWLDQGTVDALHGEGFLAAGCVCVLPFVAASLSIPPPPPRHVHHLLRIKGLQPKLAV